MSISRFYTDTATTSREGFVGSSTVKKAMTAHLTSVPCHVQALTAENAQGLTGEFGKLWLMVCAVCDIIEGDHVTVNETDTYKVSGVKTLSMGLNPHMEITLRRRAE